jgi:hypothetical protein
MPLPNKLPKAQSTAFDDDFQKWLSQLTDTVNTLAGYNGVIQLSDHIDMRGKNIKNVATPVDPTDAISSVHAESKYSPVVMRDALESQRDTQLRTYRQLNNPSQREQDSGFLNDLMSAPATSSTVIPLQTTAPGVTIQIPASSFTWANGDSLNTIPRADALTAPGVYSISSIVVSGMIGTVNSTAPVAAGGQVAISGYSDTRFNNVFQVFQIISSSQFTIQIGTENLTVGSGSLQIGGIYYYSIKKRFGALNLSPSYSGDTLQNRLQVCSDGSQIVAVVSVSSSGTVRLSSTGGGGTPLIESPAAGGFF